MRSFCFLDFREYWSHYWKRKMYWKVHCFCSCSSPVTCLHHYDCNSQYRLKCMCSIWLIICRHYKPINICIKSRPAGKDYGKNLNSGPVQFEQWSINDNGPDDEQWKYVWTAELTWSITHCIGWGGHLITCNAQGRIVGTSLALCRTCKVFKG